MNNIQFLQSVLLRILLVVAFVFALSFSALSQVDIFVHHACDETNELNYDAECEVEAGGQYMFDEALGLCICIIDSVPGCTDFSACNFNVEATEDDGSCESLSCAGCMDSEAFNYDSDATINNNDCEYVGCPIVIACNYDPTASINDINLCEYTSCQVCTSISACNFDPNGLFGNNALCVYAESGYDCNGVCLLDEDGDGVCNAFEVFGCDHFSALNFDAVATENDGSCIYNCTYSSAINYNSEATLDDGTCLFEDFDSEVVYNSGFEDGINSVICPEISSCPGDLNGDDLVSSADLLTFLSVFGSYCQVQ